MQTMTETLQKLIGKPLVESTDQEIYLALLDLVRSKSAAQVRPVNGRKLYYISAEFLIGKLLSNNMINLGIYDTVKNLLEENGKSLSAVEETEPEPSLGNGGLGRLAACFLDSIATLGLNGDGVGLNYHFGLFKQLFKDNKQAEEPNPWIENTSWLTKTDVTYKVPYKNFTLTSRMYDIEVTGYNNRTNKLHLFDVETVDESIVEDGISFDKTDIAKNLTLFLYPDDSDKEGRILRIYQQYFMVSNAARLILDEAITKGSTLYDLADYAVIQINDTHPTMVIPELIRLLTTEHNMEMDDAIEVVSHCCAYTNHTILAEALEKWPVEFFKEAVPQLLPIMEVLDDKVRRKFDDTSVYIIDKNDLVHMAHIDIHYGFSVNGVAALHTDILKETELNNFYKLYPEKFNNKTNGITFRRWLLHSNPELTNFITEFIGDGFKKDAEELKKLDTPVITKNLKQLYRLLDIKAQKKAELAKYLEETQGITINPDSIFDIQIKRLHEYKRQLLNILHVLYLYRQIKANPHGDFMPRTFIFAAKASAGYIRAKQIISLIVAASKLINNDPDVNDKLKVVFLEDYKVSLAEIIIPAADISEQISIAGKEASGTGNMKLMINGAVTIGTLDGANVEIHEQVGDENIFLFGMKAHEVEELWQRGYHPTEFVTPELQAVLDMLTSGVLGQRFDDLVDSLLTNRFGTADPYMTLADFQDYARAQRDVAAVYQDKQHFARMSLINIAKVGIFSSDRAVKEYADEIWNLD